MTGGRHKYKQARKQTNSPKHLLLYWCQSSIRPHEQNQGTLKNVQITMSSIMLLCIKNLCIFNLSFYFMCSNIYMSSFSTIRSVLKWYDNVCVCVCVGGGGGECSMHACVYSGTV